MRYSWILLTLLFLTNPHAQDAHAQSDTVGVNRFDRAVWKEVVGSKDYSEDRVREKPSEEHDSSAAAKSSDKRMKPREKSAMDEDDDSGFSFNSSLPFNYIVYALVAAVIIYMLFLIIKNMSLKSDRKVMANKPSAVIAAAIDNIQELETDKLLREAISSGNYRLAVRICFLGMLKTLDEEGVIKWKKDKTNRDYLSELFAKQHYYDEIKRLTFNYEQVWYGEHELTVNAYEEVISSFKKMGDKLNSSKRA